MQSGCLTREEFTVCLALSSRCRMKRVGFHTTTSVRRMLVSTQQQSDSSGHATTYFPLDPTTSILNCSSFPNTFTVTIFIAFNYISIIMPPPPPKRVKKVMTLPINVIFSHLQVRLQQ